MWVIGFGTTEIRERKNPSKVILVYTKDFRESVLKKPQFAPSATVTEAMVNSALDQQMKEAAVKPTKVKLNLFEAPPAFLVGMQSKVDAALKKAEAESIKVRLALYDQLLAPTKLSEVVDYSLPIERGVPMNIHTLNGLNPNTKLSQQKCLQKGITDKGHIYLIIRGESIKKGKKVPTVVVLIENETRNGLQVLKSPYAALEGKDLKQCDAFIKKALTGPDDLIQDLAEIVEEAMNDFT